MLVFSWPSPPPILHSLPQQSCPLLGSPAPHVVTTIKSLPSVRVCLLPTESAAIWTALLGHLNRRLPQITLHSHTWPFLVSGRPCRLQIYPFHKRGSRHNPCPFPPACRLRSVPSPGQSRILESVLAFLSSRVLSSSVVCSLSSGDSPLINLPVGNHVPQPLTLLSLLFFTPPKIQLWLRLLTIFKINTKLWWLGYLGNGNIYLAFTVLKNRSLN